MFACARPPRPPGRSVLATVPVVSFVCARPPRSPGRLLLTCVPVELFVCARPTRPNCLNPSSAPCLPASHTQVPQPYPVAVLSTVFSNHKGHEPTTANRNKNAFRPVSRRGKGGHEAPKEDKHREEKGAQPTGGLPTSACDVSRPSLEQGDEASIYFANFTYASGEVVAFITNVKDDVAIGGELTLTRTRR